MGGDLGMKASDLGRLFATFERSAFRFEARDAYLIPEEEERLGAFLAGRELPARVLETDDWLRLVARATRAGRQMERVRVVGRPLTDYTRFELAVYGENITAGEDIRVVERAKLPEGGSGQRWHQDFWLFDDQTVAILCYDEAGRFLGVEKGTNIDAFRQVQREALARSVPYKQFVPSGPD